LLSIKAVVDMDDDRKSWAIHSPHLLAGIMDLWATVSVSLWAR